MNYYLRCKYVILHIIDRISLVIKNYLYTFGKFLGKTWIHNISLLCGIHHLTKIKERKIWFTTNMI